MTQADIEAAFRSEAAEYRLEVGEAGPDDHLPLRLTTPFYTIEGSINRWVIGASCPPSALVSTIVLEMMQRASNGLIGRRVYA